MRYVALLAVKERGKPMRQKTALFLAVMLSALVLMAIATIGERLNGLAAALDAPSTAPSQTDIASTSVDGATDLAPLLEPTTTPAYAVTIDQATSIARKAAPQASLVSAPELVNLQGTVAYEVVLNRGKVYVDANSGALLYNGAQVLLPTVTPTPAYALTTAQAAAVALKAAPGTALMRTPELVDFQGKVAYEVVLSRGKVYVEPNSGDVLYNGATTAMADSPVNRPVNEDEAVQIATAYLQNNGNTSEAVGTRFGRAQGMRLFEITFADATRVYVNARTGEIVAVETPDGNDNDDR